MNTEPANKVIIRGYPDTIYFYPVAVVGIIIGLLHDYLLMLSFVTPTRLAALFLVVFLFCFMIVTFDISVGRVVAVVLLVLVLALLYVLLSPSIIPVEGSLDSIQAVQQADPDKFVIGSLFYLAISSGIIVILIIAVLISRLFYYEIRSTEIYYHAGIFADTKRYPAQGAQITKETNDIFERILFLAADIIIIPSGSQDVMIIKNVWRAVTKERQIREVLSYVPDSA